jgi:hypothetical protein
MLTIRTRPRTTAWTGPPGRAVTFATMRQTPADGDASSHVSGGAERGGALTWGSTAAVTDAPPPDELFGTVGATPGRGRAGGRGGDRGSRGGRRPGKDRSRRGKGQGRGERSQEHDDVAVVPAAPVAAPGWPLAGGATEARPVLAEITADPPEAPTAEPSPPPWPAPAPDADTGGEEPVGRRSTGARSRGDRDLRSLVPRVDATTLAGAGRQVERVVGKVRGRPQGVLARKRGLAAAAAAALVVGTGAGAALDALGSGDAAPEAAVVPVTSPQECAAAQVAWSRAAQAQVQMDVTDPASLRDGFARAQTALAAAPAPAAVAAQWQTVAEYVASVVAAGEGVEDGDLEAAVVGALEGLDTAAMTAASQQVTDHLATDCTG